ncbi:MAG TPA: hypothetical protein VML19_21610 [Verrucomicrobiae bacterium]|nr:hypothetical protein [Verrucomicrobiae bacterium]
MPYVTLFDISQTRFQWAYPSFGLLFLVTGLILTLVVSRWSKRRSPRIAGGVMMVFSAGWTAFAIYSTHRDYVECLEAFRRNQATVIEGTVEDFRIAPYEGMDECFRVQTATFCYSDESIQPGFHRTGARGGPIRPGLAVRITAYRGNILKLEARR